MRVEHIMSLDPVACEVGDTCVDAARLMRDREVGCVVVLDRGRVAGLVTDRMLATGCLADGGDPTRMPVENVMVRDVAAISPDDSVFTALQVMRGAGRARRLPVIGPRRELLGLVSISDLALIAQEFVDAVIEEDLHHARKRVRALTGAKRFAKRIRRPTKVDRLPPELDPQPKRGRSRAGPVRRVVPRRPRSAGGRAQGSRWRTTTGRPAGGASRRKATPRPREDRAQGGATSQGRGATREFNEGQPASQAI